MLILISYTFLVLLLSPSKIQQSCVLGDLCLRKCDLERTHLLCWAWHLGFETYVTMSSCYTGTAGYPGALAGVATQITLQSTRKLSISWTAHSHNHNNLIIYLSVRKANCQWTKGCNAVNLTGSGLCTEEVVIRSTVPWAGTDPRCAAHTDTACPVLHMFLSSVTEEPAGSCPSVLAPVGPCLYPKGQHDVLMRMTFTSGAVLL